MKDPKQGQRRYKRWAEMLLDGEVLQVIAEMKDVLKETTITFLFYSEMHRYSFTAVFTFSGQFPRQYAALPLTD